MAERWQQWMPFHIDRFLGSTHVQAMAPAARAGYLYLLARAWQSDDCTLSADPIDLATESGLGDEQWALHGPRILRKFTLLESGRYRNEPEFLEWESAREKYLVNQKRALKTNEKRRTHVGRTSDVQESNVPRTHIQEQEHKQEASQAPSELPSSAQAALTGGSTSVTVESFQLTGGKTHSVTEADVASWQRAYPAVNIPGELRKLTVWLDANPDKRSATVNGNKQRIVRWMTREQNAGGSRLPPQSSRPDACVGMFQVRPEKSEEERKAELDVIRNYWAHCKDKNPAKWAAEAPRWIKDEVAA